MAVTGERVEIGIRRHYTDGGRHPYELLTWERRDSRISDYRTGAIAFEQPGVEVPASWSVNATNILAQKYFRGTVGTAEREWSLRQVVDRVVDTITAWGLRDGYFVDEAEAAVFSDELKYLIVTQKAAFNSPVWFNIGVSGVPQPGLGVLHSRCRGLDVGDLELVRRRRNDLQGWLGLGSQPLENPWLEGAAGRRRDGLGPGELHARCRRIGRDDQVGWQDAPCGEDGHPRC